jgi:hypothetical protein
MQFFRYLGRIAIFEVLKISDHQQNDPEGSSAKEIEQQAGGKPHHYETGRTLSA